MKLLKTLSAASLALALVSSANAASYTVHICGSSAFRKAVHAAIIHALTSPVANWKDTTKNLGSCSQAVFQGTISSDTYTVETSWSGSASGVYALTSGTTISGWMTSANSMASVSATTSQGAVSFTTTATGIASPTTETAAADLAMSDVFQTTTIFTSPTLNDQKVGVVPFYWVRSKGSNSRITNISPNQIRGLLSGGTTGGGVVTAQLTGSTLDEAGWTVVIGRDEDSGTRITAFAEGGFGANTLAGQYKPTISSGVITDLAPWPANTVNNIAYPVGDSGESSGGTLAADVSNTLSSSNSVGATDIVTYLGESDAATAVSGGCTYLTFNGVTFGAGAGYSSGSTVFYKTIQDGQYTFWSYEHLYSKSGISTPIKTFRDALYTQIHDNDAIGTGVRMGDMNVNRSVEGGVISWGGI